MIAKGDVAAVAKRLIRAYDTATSLPPITSTLPGFDVPAAYDVLAAIERSRIEQGWQPVGRKIGFTNRTIWPRYGVYQPMAARIWSHTLHQARDGAATLSLSPFVRPRIEPEVVFRLAGPPPAVDDPLRILAAVEWIAPGFEIVQSHFPDWRFTAADCTAAFGLHGALVVGTPLLLDHGLREAIAARLSQFELTLRRGEVVVDRGIGANVLGSPALALAYLVRALVTLPQFPPLAAGEVITTGTLTDAWPLSPGETWRSDYGTLGIGSILLGSEP
jgi:2-oxo-3-hexenedioate decarboxylase